MTTPAIEGEPTGEVIRKGRPPWWFIAVLVVLLAVVVGGNFAAGWINRNEPTSTTAAPRALDELLAASVHAVVVRVDGVELISDAEEPEVIAQIRVLDDLGRGPAAGERLTVYDTSFEEAWKEGERALLFLARADDPVAAGRGATFRVVRGGRFLLGDALARRATFTVEEVRARIAAS